MSGLFRRYPFLVATTAASGGVLLGAYMAFQIFAAPVDPRGVNAPPQPVARTNATATDTRAPAVAPETTGSAPAKEDVATGDRCTGQTWPNLTRDCMEQKQSRQSRTASTERTGKPVPQAPPIASVPSNDTATASAPAAAPVEPQAPAAQQAAVSNDPPAVADAKPANAKPADAKPANDSAKAEKRKVKEAKRKAKKPKGEEGDDRSFAYAPNGDHDDASGDRRSLRTEDRSRRERVIVRGEDDEDSDRASERGDRRVIVIRRERDGGFGGGIFGNLFGN